MVARLCTMRGSCTHSSSDGGGVAGSPEQLDAGELDSEGVGESVRAARLKEKWDGVGSGGRGNLSVRLCLRGVC
jgi:hypothetical protein